MNKSEEFNDDVLKRYINHEKIEKAPAGFTERLNIRLQSERVPVYARTSFLRNYRVPVISGLITISLIIAAVLLPSTDNDSLLYSLVKSMNDITIAFPKLNLQRFSFFTLPELTTYISLGIFLLSIFDRLLNTYFHRERK